eukprot:CAMPEP_0172016750 /NCGR_PEP_ID=MMETSP1041-20130122/11190_1 /TAXON_ID=464988 /ORGANISM="Hemiselmis andersenii, Strain CCMP439" /LENGTH=325 /DNA_ID=CAMNT_0012671719 /DNA_START=79 /DNA_END=1058 /DNA_ORIENTATION=+
MAVAGFVQLGGAAEECGLGAVAGKRLGATVDGETECISSRGGRVWAARALRPGDMELERCQEGAEDAWAAHAPGSAAGRWGGGVGVKSVRVGGSRRGFSRGRPRGEAPAAAPAAGGPQPGDRPAAGGESERQPRGDGQTARERVEQLLVPAGGLWWSREHAGGHGPEHQPLVAIIAVALVALTAASVPKLTRMDIDVDYSPMMRDCKLSLDALARPPPQPHRSSERWSSPASPSVDTVRSATDMLTGASHHAEAKKGGDVHSLRLRGGEKSPQFTPSQSSHDLRVRGGCGSPRSCQTEDGGTLSPDFFAAGRRYQPKLSRTVDAH